MSSSAMWYKNGNFYEVPTTHIDFFLQNPELLGFTQEEKEQLCIENGIPADSTTWLDTTQERTDILLEVLKRGAIRIRFYGGKTSVQCYDHNNKMNYRELQNCVIDGLGKCFGSILTVLDTKGWGEMLNDMGWGRQIKDFISSSVHKSNYRYFNIYKEKPVMSGYEKNNNSLNKIFSNQDISNCIVNERYVSIGKLIESNIRLYDLIKGKHAEKGYCIVSACRGDKTHAENNARTKQLAADIKSAGYSYMPVYGGYIEDDNGEVLEASFVIFNYDNRGNSGDFNDLKSFAIDMCGKYNQDSILICEPGNVPTYYNRNGQVVSDPSKSSDKVKVNDKNEPYFTKFKNKSKQFTYDIAFPDEDDELTSSLARILSSYDYLRKRPMSYGERHRRWSYGEVFV